MVDRFYYYSKSKDVDPGKGTNEFVADISEYENLKKIKDWRKVLSNFYEHDFIFDDKKYGDGLKYRTVEHCFQAQKIKLSDKDIAYGFSLDSKDDIGLGDGNTARKNRKIILLDKKILLTWDKIKDKMMKAINKCKYNQCKLFKKVLNLTNNAELWHIVMRSKPIHAEYLEEIRFT